MLYDLKKDERKNVRCDHGMVNIIQQKNIVPNY